MYRDRQSENKDNNWKINIKTLYKVRKVNWVQIAYRMGENFHQV